MSESVNSVLQICDVKTDRREGRIRQSYNFMEKVLILPVFLKPKSEKCTSPHKALQCFISHSE